MKKYTIVFLLVFFGTFYVMRTKFPTPRVETAKSPDQFVAEMQKTCTTNKAVCYNRFLYKIAIEKGYDLAYRTLLALQKKDSEALQCHLFAHTIGKGVFNHDPKSWKNVLAHATSACSYGVGHGLIESYSLTLKPEALRTSAVLLDICKNQPSNCTHVLGHSIILEYKGDLDQSISQCAIFNKSEREYCYNGVFMEYAYPETLVEHGYVNKSLLILPPRLPELASLCNGFKDTVVSTECWGEMVHPLFDTYKQNYQKAFDFCGTAHTLQASSKCIDGLVGGIIVAKNFDLQGTRSICTLKARRSNFEDTCYAILVSTSLTYLPSQHGPKAVEFCNSLEDQFKRNCFQTVAIKLTSNIKKQDAEAICASIPKEYRSSCIAI